MFKIRFFLGAPHSQPRTQVAEMDSLQECAWKALEEARPKGKMIGEMLDAAYEANRNPLKPRTPKVCIEVAVFKDDGQLPLFDLPVAAPMPPKPKPEWQPSGDFVGIIELAFNENQLQIGQVEYANTNAASALGRSVETARQLIDRLKKDPSMKPARSLLNFSNVTVTVERANDNLLLFPIREEPRDWSSLTFPQPRL